MAVKQYAWKYSPSFLLRRFCLVDVIRGWVPGKFLECGAGTGAMTQLFLDNGYSGVGYDVSEKNLEVLRKNLGGYGGRFIEVGDLSNQPNDFDYLFAFEVLEHIGKDCEVLAEWSRHLAPAGRILISVPARMKKFRSDDKYVGHLRRYEKAELKKMLVNCGYEEIRILSYGVPLANITRVGGDFLHRWQMKRHQDITSLEAHERSVRSGIERIDSINHMSFFFNPITLWLPKIVQRWFYTMDLGEGYVATGVKKTPS